MVRWYKEDADEKMDNDHTSNGSHVYTSKWKKGTSDWKTGRIERYRRWNRQIWRRFGEEKENLF